MPSMLILANNVLPRSAMIVNIKLSELNINSNTYLRHIIRAWFLSTLLRILKVEITEKAERIILTAKETEKILLDSCCTREQLRQTAVDFLVCVTWHCAGYCEWQHCWHMMHHTGNKSSRLIFMLVNHVKLSTYLYIVNDMLVLLIVSKWCRF